MYPYRAGPDPPPQLSFLHAGGPPLTRNTTRAEICLLLLCACAVNGDQWMGAVKKMQCFLSRLHNGDDGMHAQKDKAGAL